MNSLPKMDDANQPKESTMWDNLHKKVALDMTGMDEALRVVAQKRTYNGGQIDLFPQELIDESPLFCGVVEATKGSN